MKVDNEFFDRVKVSLVEGKSQELSFTLHIVSKKGSKIKELDPQWNEEQWVNKKARLVVIATIGQEMFALTHAQHAVKLDDLAIEGKKVSVKALTAEEAQQLAEAVEMFVISASAVEQEEDPKVTKPAVFRSRQAGLHAFVYDKNKLVSYETQTVTFLARMKNEVAEIILDCLKRMDETRREDKKQQEIEDKHNRIRNSEIRRADARLEISKEAAR